MPKKFLVYKIVRFVRALRDAGRDPTKFAEPRELSKNMSIGRRTFERLAAKVKNLEGKNDAVERSDICVTELVSGSQ
jgi:hypothetical protein